MREEILKITMTVDDEKVIGTTIDQVRGPRGYSAYEVAVLLGYVGTEESWLESLKGVQGRSAYRVAVDEGFVGTVNEWRDSLIGPKGPAYDDSDLREQIDLELASLTRIASEAADIATTKAGEAVDAKNIVVLRADEVNGHAVILYGLFNEIEDYRQEVYSRAIESVEQAGIATTKAGEADQSAQASAQSALDAHDLLDVVAGLPTLIKHYILSTPFTPYHLFVNKEKGFLVDPSDTSTLSQNSDGTIPVVDGDPIGLVLDKSGNNYILTQTVSASRPKLLNGGIVFDRVDDALTLTIPAGGITGTLFLATTRGTASYSVSMPAGVWKLGNNYNPLGDVVSAMLVDRALTVDEKARLHMFGVGKGGTEFGSEKSVSRAWSGWGHLVDFPLIDTSRVTNFSYAWFGCAGLTSLPLIDVSKGTIFQQAWAFCSNLVSFPANFFDNCLATNFISAFSNTNFSQASIDGILVSINSNNTARGSLHQSGGSAPSSVGQAAIDAMRARGWTVVTTGGY